MNKGRYRSQLLRRLMVRYVLTFVIFAAAFIALFFIARGFLGMFRWYADDPLYNVLNWFQEYWILWGGLVLLCGWVIISYRFMLKPMRYLDEIITASEKLANPTKERITLPVEMASVEHELNQVREQALLNAALAREAEQKKNDLIVYLAHDLKTPLTSVIGYLSLLQDEPDLSPEQRAKYTGIALDKAARLEELINEFFDIMRFNFKSISLNLESVNLSRMTEQVTSEFEPILAERGLEWDMIIEPDIMLVCDPDKLERVFDNLIRNAVNYSYRDTVITLSLRRSADGAVLHIRNRGKTIPSEKLDKIFEQFFRLDASRTTATGGAGLGLAIAREIVEAHGGRITAASANEGIEFTVTLPDLRQKIV